jgi:hypothetical protein
MLRNCCAEPADLKRCIFQSRRHDLVRVLGPIVHAQPLLMPAGQVDLPEGGGVGGQLVEAMAHWQAAASEA